ncbi:MAG: hypothetical protein WC867_07775 [Candidatus Pacearchaeota archaeon]|jgi:hypothetical protein
MIKKCEKCKVPLDGWRYKFIARPLFGVKPGKNKNICNKCENKLINKRRK